MSVNRHPNTVAAGRNKIINGDFGVWQRGTSFSNPTNGTYVADRWYVAYQNAAPTTSSVSQQPFTAGSAPVAGYESAYYLRCAFTTIGSNTIWRLDQKIEDVRTFAGQTVTLSFWARSNNSTGLSIFAVQNTGTGGSGGGAPSVVTTISSASWTRYSLTIPIPSLSGATIGTGSNLEIMFQLNSLASGTNFDLWGVQVEAGSVATPFTTASGTLQGELALCQRYYFRINPGSSSSYLVCGESPSTTQWRGVVTFPVAMRSGPTLDGTVSSTYFTVYQKFGGNGSAGPTLIDSNVSSAYLYANSGTAGLVAGNAAHLGAASTSAYLAFIAEL